MEGQGQQQADGAGQSEPKLPFDPHSLTHHLVLVTLYPCLPKLDLRRVSWNEFWRDFQQVLEDCPVAVPHRTCKRMLLLSLMPRYTWRIVDFCDGANFELPWEEFHKRLRDVFVLPGEIDYIKTVYEERKQGANEDIVHYVNVKKKLYDEAGFGGSGGQQHEFNTKFVPDVIEGLVSKRIAAELLFERLLKPITHFETLINTISVIVKAVKAGERTALTTAYPAMHGLRDFNQGKSAPPPGGVGTASRSTYRVCCYNCGQVGHIRRHCRNQADRRRCYWCKCLGHIERNCVRKKREKSRRGEIA